MPARVKIQLRGPKGLQRDLEFELEEGVPFPLAPSPSDSSILLGNLLLKQDRLHFIPQAKEDPSESFTLASGDRIIFGEYSLKLCSLHWEMSSSLEIFLPAVTSPEIHASKIPEDLPEIPRIELDYGKRIPLPKRAELAKMTPPPQSKPAKKKPRPKAPSKGFSIKDHPLAQAWIFAYLSIALATGAAKLGNPLFLGLLGTVLLAALTTLFHQTRSYTGLKGDWAALFRHLSFLSAGWVIWGAVARFSWPLGSLIGLAVGIMILHLFSLKFEANFRKLLRAGGWATALPAIFTLSHAYFRHSTPQDSTLNTPHSAQTELRAEALPPQARNIASFENGSKNRVTSAPKRARLPRRARKAPRRTGFRRSYP